MSAVAMRAVGPVVVALLVSSVSVGHAAVTAGTPASLEDCVTTALEHSPTILSARAGRDLSAAGVTGAWAPILPHLSPLSAGYSRTYFGPTQGRRFVFNGQEFPSDVPSYTGPPSVSLGITASTDALSLSQWKDLGRARSDLRASVYDERDSRASIALAVVQSYYGLVGAERTRDVANEAVGNARDRQRRARAFYEVGTVARGDVSKAVRDLAQAELDSITAENAVAVARSRLASTIGLDPVTDVRVITDLPEPDTTSMLSIQELESVKSGEAPASSATVDNRPDIRALRARAEAAHASTASAKANLWPSLSTSYSYRWNANELPSSDAPLNKNYSWTLSLDMTVPVFDWLTNHARISEAAAAERQSEYRLLDQRQLATQELVQARLDLNAAAGRLRVAKVGLAAAEDDYAFSRERYGVGAGTSLELGDAQLGLSRAKVSYIDALVQARVAVAALARAEGRPVVPSHPETGGDAR